MADNKTDLELKLRATGGKESAAEVEVVEDAYTRLKTAGQEALDTDATITEKREALLALSEALNEAAASAEQFGTADEAASAQIAKMREEIEAAHTALDKQVEIEAKGIPITAASTVESKAKAAALRRLEGAVNSLIPGAGELRNKISNLTDAWKASGTAGASFGSRLTALAGGPVGIIAAAITGLIAVFANYKKSVQEVNDITNEAAQSANDYLKELDSTKLDDYTDSTGGLADAVSDLADEQARANEEFRIQAERLEAIKEAQDRAAKAEIDAQVAAETITPEEGKAQKAEIDAAALQREVDLKKELADSTLAAAEADAQRAKEAEVAASTAAAAAAAEFEKTKAQSGEKVTAALDEGKKAKQIANLSPLDLDANKKALNLAGGEEAAQELITEMKGFTGTVARARLFYGESAESILGGTAERAGVAKVMAEQAALEVEAAEMAADRAVTAAKEKADEKAKELEAVKKLREAAEKEVSEAAATAEQTNFDRDLTMQYEVPVKQQEADSARAQAEKKAAEKAAKEAELAQQAKLESDVNAKGMAIADDLGNRIASAKSAGGDPALIAKLEALQAMLSDGTNQNELGKIMTRLTAIAEAAVGKSTALEGFAQGLAARVAALESQTRNAPSRQ